MAWFWQKQDSKAKTQKLSWEQIQRLKNIGDDYAEFMGKGGRDGGATPSKLLDSATRSEIRAGLIEVLVAYLQLGTPFKEQIKLVRAIETLFHTTMVFGISAAGGKREIESREIRSKYLGLFDEFEDLIVKDEGRRFEVNEDEIREKIVVKLIEQTK